MAASFANQVAGFRWAARRLLDPLERSTASLDAGALEQALGVDLAWMALDPFDLNLGSGVERAGESIASETSGAHGQGASRGATGQPGSRPMRAPLTEARPGPRPMAAEPAQAETTRTRPALSQERRSGPSAAGPSMQAGTGLAPETTSASPRPPAQALTTPAPTKRAASQGTSITAVPEFSLAALARPAAVATKGYQALPNESGPTGKPTSTERMTPSGRSTLSAAPTRDGGQAPLATPAMNAQPTWSGQDQTAAPANVAPLSLAANAPRSAQALHAPVSQGAQTLAALVERLYQAPASETAGGPGRVVMARGQVATAGIPVRPPSAPSHSLPARPRHRPQDALAQERRAAPTSRESTAGHGTELPAPARLTSAAPVPPNPGEASARLPANQAPGRASTSAALATPAIYEPTAGYGAVQPAPARLASELPLPRSASAHLLVNQTPGRPRAAAPQAQTLTEQGIGAPLLPPDAGPAALPGDRWDEPLGGRVAVPYAPAPALVSATPPQLGTAPGSAAGNPAPFHSSAAFRDSDEEDLDQAERINRVLRDQARRRGVDLS